MTIFEKKMKILLYTPVFQIRIFSFRGSNNIFFYLYKELLKSSKRVSQNVDMESGFKMN